MEDGELDILESAADQEESDEFLNNARLSCQVEITSAMHNAVIKIPEVLHNMLEIPLWLRKR